MPIDVFCIPQANAYYKLLDSPFEKMKTVIFMKIVTHGINIAVLYTNTFATFVHK